jgi:integrase
LPTNRQQVGKAAKTLNEYLDSANCLLNWMKGVQRIDENPLNIVKKSETRGEEVRVRRAWRDDEVSRLLKVAGVSAVGYLLAVQTGLRRSELKALRWEQFDLDAETPCVWLQRKETKNRGGGWLPLHPELVTQLQAIKPSDAQPHDPVLVGKMLAGMWKMKSDLKKAGISYKENGRYADFHALRHTLGTNLSRRNVPPRVAMELMRHSDIRLTMNYYTDTNQLPLSDAISKLPAFTTGTNPQIHPQTADVCSQIESQLGIQLDTETPPNIIHPDRFSREVAQVDTAQNGSSGRIRTYDQSVNSRPLYH